MNKEKSSRLAGILDNSSARMVALFVVVFIICSVLQGKNFLSPDNFLAMFRQFPEYGLLAIGIGMALIIGGIDLSAVYLANLSSIVAGLFIHRVADHVHQLLRFAGALQADNELNHRGSLSLHIFRLLALAYHETGKLASEKR